MSHNKSQGTVKTIPSFQKCQTFSFPKGTDTVDRPIRLRATIPEKMVKYLELDVGDILIWDIQDSLKGEGKKLIIEKWER